MEAVDETAVDVSMLDGELAGICSILILKIDTQGSELNILEGGQITLRKTHFVLVEMLNHKTYVNSKGYYEVDEYLRAHGLRLRNITVEYRERKFIRIE
jgi:hypothetical protein